jgi:hypothetical protein
MKRIYTILIFLATMSGASAQQVADLFKPSDHEIVWLGIDFSHVKLIGGFSQFLGAGEKSVAEIKELYFPGWNRLILDEPYKYDVKGMMRKGDITYAIKMVTEINADTKLEELESDNTPKYEASDIKRFISEYDLPVKTGISFLFIAESLNKRMEEAYFHFVAIRNSDKEILLTERLWGRPMGIGLRNYWAGAIHYIMDDIQKDRYQEWKTTYLKKRSAE